MRNLLIILALTLAASALAGDLRLEDSSFSTLAYIREDGRIEDDSFQTLGYIRDEGEDGTRIEDVEYNTLGYIDEGEIENAEYEETFGHVYLVCASGKFGTELLDILRGRLRNDPATERSMLRTELAAINRIRLARLIDALAGGTA